MTYTEILDLISRNTTTQNSTTSSYTTAAKTVDVNNALNQYFILANTGAGNWRPADDTNQTDYPVVYFDLVSGQQDYSFTVDANGNQILDIYKVRIKDSNGVDWQTLNQLNKDGITDADLSTVGSGIPTDYYLTANGIFLVQKPNYNSTAGGEIHIARTASYFTTSDTTKKAGIPWVHHEYLALRPSYFYCLAKGLPQASAYKIALYGEDGKGGMEAAIRRYYRDRNHDFQQAITGERINSI
jgi:hypothetical protein